MIHVYPFAAIVGQEELKLALLLNAVLPSVGGVLAMGERGTGKSTAVRALAGLLPPLARVRGCAFNCDPDDETKLCDGCRARLRSEGRLPRERASVPVVELPLGATEDRVCGTIDLERALSEGVRAFEPGLLARANRGFLYIDEVNLLEDHLVDLLLDAAATGRNKVEREGVSAEHPAEFVLAGSGNPEEGELRPQLLDRFGLFVEVRTTRDVDERVEIVERGEAFALDPEKFLSETANEQARLRRRLARARAVVASVEVPRALVRRVAEVCARLGVDGHRGELTWTRAARALAAFEGRRAATDGDARRVAAMSLRHRLRRDPLEQSHGGERIEQALAETFGDDDATPRARRRSGSGDGSENNGGGKSSHEKSARRNSVGDKPAPEKSRSGKSASRESSSNNPRGGKSRVDEPRADDSQGGSRAHDARSSDGAARGGDGRIVPASPSSMPEGADDYGATRGDAGRGRAANLSRTRGGKSAGSSVESGGGRYARAVASRTLGNKLALDATLRAAAPSLRARRQQVTPDASERVRQQASVERVHRNPSGQRACRVAPDELRFKQFRRKRGALFIVALDASGSMAANRIGQAKGALAHLLRRSYVRRDRVALVTFRERDAALLLAPSRSHERARRLLDALPVGGATPLAAGLLRALEVAERAAREGARRIVLLVFTDARANVPLRAGEGEDRAARARRIRDELARLGTSLRRAGVSSVVIDTAERFTSGGEAGELAAALGGRRLRLPAHADARRVAEQLDAF